MLDNNREYIQIIKRHSF